MLLLSSIWIIGYFFGHDLYVVINMFFNLQQLLFPLQLSCLLLFALQFLLLPEPVSALVLGAVGQDGIAGGHSYLFAHQQIQFIITDKEKINIYTLVNSQ